MNNINSIATTEFQQVQGIITLRRSKALQTVNNENLLTAWEVGAYVSTRLKNSAWGSKTVKQLSEYLRAQDPTLRGYSTRNIYNMVAFYEAYSSIQFAEYQEKLKLNEFVQTKTAQIGNIEIEQSIIQPAIEPIVQFQTAQFPNFLNITTLTNHFEIINACKTIEERIFYVLYMANNNTFTGNTNAYIHISQSMNTYILTDMTLHHLNGYPWYFESGLYINEDRTYTIEPGAVILMGASEGIRVYEDAHLLASGTAENRITIQGKNNTAGYWKDIEVSSLTPGTKFDYCNISGGGAGSTADFGLIRYRANSYLELYNCNLSKSLHSGVVCDYSSSNFNVHYNAYLKQSNNTFSEITDAVFRIVEPDAGSFGALPGTGTSWWQFY